MALHTTCQSESQGYTRRSNADHREAYSGGDERNIVASRYLPGRFV